MTAIVATLVCAIALRRGIPINADGWAYWEGAYGLAHGGAYVYLGGAPVEAFPPPYSMLLAGAAAGTNGFSGLSLVCVALVTTFVAAFAWGLFLWRACAGTATSALYGRGPLLVFVAFVLPLWNADVRAEQVTRCIVPLLALALLKPRRDAPVDVVRPPGKWTALVVAGLLTLGVVVKHSFAAWVPAVVVVLFLSRMRRDLVCVVAVVPFCAWWILRSCMDQVGSHAIATLTFANILKRLHEVYIGIGKSVGIEHVGPALLCVACTWALRTRDRDIVRVACVAAAVQLMTLASLASFVQISDPLHARFVGSTVIWLVLVCALALLLHARDRPRRTRWMVHGLVTLLMVVPAVKSVRNASRGYGPRTVLHGQEESFVGLERKLLEGVPPLLPPDYPWIQRAPTRAR